MDHSIITQVAAGSESTVTLTVDSSQQPDRIVDITPRHLCTQGGISSLAIQPSSSTTSLQTTCEALPHTTQSMMLPDQTMLPEETRLTKQRQQSPDAASSTEQYPTQSPTESSFQMADSNSPKQTFVPCKVCGDKASGYHYGVTSCEGCKGFFRRSIQKQIEYRCLRDGKCMVIRLNRNRCQYCRFKKCLAVGMSRDSVRYGRVPKRTKSQEEQRVSTTEGQQEASALESRQLAIYDIILTISQAHHANCQLTEDKVKAIVHKPFSLLQGPLEDNEAPPMIKQEEPELTRLKMFQSVAELMDPSIHSVVEFSKRLSGFQELGQDDQLILIKTGFFEVWLLRQTRMFNPVTGLLTFENGNTVSRKELEIVYEDELAESMFDFAANFSQLRLNDTEMGLLSGVVIATADRLGLTDMKAVERIQENLIEALRLQISRNHSTEPHMFANVLMKLPELRMLGSKHCDLLSWVRTHWDKLQLPPLFSEIFDVPKNGEEALTEASHVDS